TPRYGCLPAGQQFLFICNNCLRFACYNSRRIAVARPPTSVFSMSEYICRLGTPSGEVITRIVEASAASDAKSQLELEGFRVFAVSSSASGLSAVLPIGSGKKGRIKQSDFLLFNQQLSALLRAGIP